MTRTPVQVLRAGFPAALYRIMSVVAILTTVFVLNKLLSELVPMARAVGWEGLAPSLVGLPILLILSQTKQFSWRWDPLVLKPENVI